jgi:hypothetical protein
MAAPTLSVVPDKPGMLASAPADPSSDGEPEPEPEPAPAAAFLLELVDGDGVAAALATVITGAFAVAFRVELPSVTVTVALYWTFSPAVAVFGTVTCVSTSAWAGLAVGTLSVQVVPLVLAQLSTVNTGAANAGVLLLGVSVDVILPVALALRLV